MLAAGQVIDRYELVCPIGDGGMARVWAARQRGLHGFEKLFALKIIHTRFAEHQEFRAMFLDEARVVAALAHPNVAQVFDLGETGGLLYLVMEYVDGESLFGMIAPNRTVPLAVAMRITADVCAGLHAVHGLVDGSGRPRNVVHRDVSPQNVLLTLQGDVKLIDFGIAHARDRVAQTTDASMVKGKVRYMAPEQAHRGALGPGTDVFGAGAVLFRMLTGRAPYASESDVTTMQALLAYAPPLNALPPEVPSAVAAIIQRAIAPHTRDRYASARELQVAIEGWFATQAGQRPDVAWWVKNSLTEPARERHAIVTGRALAPASQAEPSTHGPAPARVAVPELGSVPAMPAPAAVAGTGTAPLHAPITLPSREAKDPSFMDVRALVAGAQHRPVAALPPPPPLASHPAAAAPRAQDPQAAPDAPSSPEQAAPRPNVVPVRAPPKPETSGALAFKLAIAAVVLVVLIAAGLLLAPAIVKDRAIASAREAGFEMTVEKVSVGLGGATLRGVGLKATRTPGIAASTPEIFLAGLTGKEGRISDLDVRLTGSESDIGVGLGAILAENRARFAGTPTAPRKLTLAGVRVTWDGLAGEGSKLEASGVGLEIDSRGAGVEEVHGNVGRLHLKTSTASVGPWAAVIDSTPSTSRVRVLFDPPVPDGPSLLWVWGRNIPGELTVRIPRSPFANLGLDPVALGLPADAATELEATVHGKLPAGGNTELKFEVALHAARPKGFRGPVDLRVEGAATGASGKPLELERTIATLGPFTAGVTGTITPHDRGLGLRLDAMFKTLPLTCERLVHAEAKSAGPLAVMLQALGQSTGAVRVTGVVNASGVVAYDSGAPEEASLTWLAKETCGVSIFGM